jgi:hypothetical protein
MSKFDNLTDGHVQKNCPTSNAADVLQPPLILVFSLRFAQGERGAEPVPLPSAPLRENRGHETDRFAAAQPRVRPKN